MPNAHGKIIANVERLHALMDEEGFSAIVARSGKNFTYLAGFAYPGTLARHLEFPDSPRGGAAGLAPDGRASDGAELIRRASGTPRFLAGTHRGS